MRKKIIDDGDNREPAFEPEWLDIQQIASVELTSEDPEHPIELAFSLAGAGEWRASQPGEQIIRLKFDAPQQIRLMSLMFVERQIQRTQQFEIAYTGRQARHFQHVVRQQWNFAPGNDSNTEIEEYFCSIEDALTLELKIIPDLDGGKARASLQEWKIAK